MFSKITSKVSLVTLTYTVELPSFNALATNVNTTFSPFVKFPTYHLPEVMSNVPFVALYEIMLKVFGTNTLAIVFIASLGPLFMTVTVQTTESPMYISDLSATMCISKSAISFDSIVQLAVLFPTFTVFVIFPDLVTLATTVKSTVELAVMFTIHVIIPVAGLYTPPFEALMNFNPSGSTSLITIFVALVFPGFETAIV